ncbi:Nucleoside hydrolase 3 [Dionaea muscipula]
MTMRIQQWVPLLLVMVIFGEEACRARPHHHHHRILLDTDVGIDDVFALLYLLKLDRAEFDLKGVTLNANGWSDAGHAVNHVYDILYMMGRDDIPVGVGGEGGILEGGTILPNVGGYLPLIEQGMSTTGYCRYRQAIPVGSGGGRLDIDTNFGIRKEFLPQGSRRYSPMGQATAQQVMIDVISEGPTNVLLTGAQTNFAIFLMSNPQLKSNVQHIYAMGGSLAIGATNCCRYPNTEMSSSCKPSLCGEPAGNLFSNHDSNPYAEFNMFSDPFAAYQVIHSGIPVTLVPLDATNTIPITRQFYDMLEKNQRTYEAQYVYKSMKMVHDTRLDDMFFNNYYIWDTFAAGVAVSIMSKPDDTDGENDFANMKYVNITLVTSNKPYGISDGSNPFFDGCQIPRFHLENGGVHSGHVQTRLHDPFCSIKKNEKGKCQDGYTMVTTGSEAAQVLVATEAKPSKVPSSLLDREFFVSFLEVLNRPQNSGRFNFTTQFPHYMPVYYKPNFVSTKLGKPIIFDIDMSAGDFLALFYLLKVPVEVLDLKAVLVTPTGWASAATVEVVYDLLHMMGRDDIPVGLGDFFAMNQSDPIYAGVGDCNYSKAIPNGRGGLLDSDTLYGLARDLPRSPRRYTVENSIKYGAPRDTDHPELRQASALEIWKNVTSSTDHGSKITVLTNGPLTTLAKIILLEENSRSLIEEVYIVGGYVNYSTEDKGNLFTVPSNDFAEFNMFLDPLAAKTVFDSELVVTLIPLDAQRQVCSFPRIHEKLYQTKRTPEALFAQRLLSQLERLQKEHPGYKHMDIFLGEILGAVILAGDYYHLNSTKKAMQISVFAPGNESIDGQIAIDGKDGKPVNVLEEVNQTAFADIFASRLGERKQSAVLEY